MSQLNRFVNIRLALALSLAVNAVLFYSIGRAQQDLIECVDRTLVVDALKMQPEPLDWEKYGNCNN